MDIAFNQEILLRLIPQRYMLNKTKTNLLLLIFFVVSNQIIWAQFTIPSKPQNNMYVYDYIDLLNKQQKESLQNKLYRYDDSTSTQIVIAIIDDLHGEDISMLGTKWAHEWGIGGKEEDNGVFILIKKDKTGPGGQIDIATGYGIEYRMTDRMTKQVINQVVLPNFKQNQYYQGLDQAIDRIISILSGEFKNDNRLSRNADAWFPVLFLLFIIFIILFNKRKHGGGRGNGRHRPISLLDMLILSSMGSSSGTGYSSGGGFSGGSFGGGGFGGGGASGRW